MTSTAGQVANIDAGTLVDAQIEKPKPEADTKPAVVLDIEHAVVKDDPRLWSKGRKVSSNSENTTKS